MKIIDILNKKANGTLEDGFKFGYNYQTYSYDKKKDKIAVKSGCELGQFYKLDNHLNDEVEVIEESKEIGLIPEIALSSCSQRGLNALFQEKINKIIQAVNKQIKEREEK